MNEKIVWITKVISRNFITDFISNANNILGGRLKSYEKMIDKTLIEVNSEFNKKYPLAKDIRMEITEFTNGAMAIIIHGVIKDEHE